MRKPAQTFHNIVVLQDDHQVVLLVYKFAKLFPKEKEYTLASPLRRSSIAMKMLVNY